MFIAFFLANGYLFWLQLYNNAVEFLTSTIQLQRDGVDHSISEQRRLQQLSWSWKRMADTLNIRFTNRLHYKIIVVTNVVF